MTIYIRPQDRDTRYPLWHIPYRCRVPYIQTMSVEELAEKGIYTSGVAAYDHATAWEPRLISISVVKMIMLWSQGANIYIVDMDSACRQIYDDIQKHLEAWVAHINSSYNLRNYPEEDLKMMDQFNAVMYEHAKWVDRKVTWDGLLASRKSTTVSIASFNEFFNKRDRELQEARRKKNGAMGAARYQSERGLQFVEDPSTRRAEYLKLADMSHAGRDAPDPAAPRMAWQDLLERHSR